MKRTRWLAKVAVAILALIGFLSPLGSRWDGARPALAQARVEQAGQQLTTGCNQITETGLPTGGKVSDWLNQHIQPVSALISVWHYDNATQKYKAVYFYDPAVPVDVPTFTQPIDAFFVCVNANATAP